jgi:multiple sugar transport system ATP-binding protein
MTLADRIVVLEFGKIAQVGTPRELYERPANLFVAQFIGSPRMNVVPAQTIKTLDLPDGTFSIGMRPEHIELVPAGTGQIEGKVDVLEYLGADTFVIVSCDGDQQITVRVNGTSDLKPGDDVSLVVGRQMIHAFNSDGLAIR